MEVELELVQIMINERIPSLPVSQPNSLEEAIDKALTLNSIDYNLCYTSLSSFSNLLRLKIKLY